MDPMQIVIKYVFKVFIIVNYHKAPVDFIIYYRTHTVSFSKID